jgi:hypothetical protein
MYASCEKIVVVYEICNLIGKIGRFQMLDHINLKYILYLKSKNRNLATNLIFKETKGVKISY